MNKYQEALDRIESAAYYGGEKGDNVELLQELVDRATPKKPIVKIANGVRHIDCPNCDDGYSHNFIENKELNDNYCSNCGQAFDWSNGEQR